LGLSYNKRIEIVKVKPKKHHLISLYYEEISAIFDFSQQNPKKNRILLYWDILNISIFIIIRE